MSSSKVQLKEELSKSGNSVVYSGRLRDSIEFVVFKMYGKEKRAQVMREHAMLQEVRNLSHVIKFKDFMETGGHLWIGFEFCPGCNLEKVVTKDGRFDEARFTPLAIQICTGVFQVHSRHIVHNQIQAKHVVFASDGSIRLVDLARAHRIGEGSGTVARDLCMLGRMFYYMMTTDSRPSRDVELGRHCSSELGDLISKLIAGRLTTWAEVMGHSFWKGKLNHLKQMNLTPSPQVPHFDISSAKSESSMLDISMLPDDTNGSLTHRSPPTIMTGSPPAAGCAPGSNFPLGGSLTSCLARLKETAPLPQDLQARALLPSFLGEATRLPGAPHEIIRRVLRMDSAEFVDNLSAVMQLVPKELAADEVFNRFPEFIERLATEAKKQALVFRAIYLLIFSARRSIPHELQPKLFTALSSASELPEALVAAAELIVAVRATEAAVPTVRGNAAVALMIAKIRTHLVEKTSPSAAISAVHRVVSCLGKAQATALFACSPWTLVRDLLGATDRCGDRSLLAAVYTVSRTILGDDVDPAASAAASKALIALATLLPRLRGLPTNPDEAERECASTAMRYGLGLAQVMAAAIPRGVEIPLQLADFLADVGTSSTTASGEMWRGIVALGEFCAKTNDEEIFPLGPVIVFLSDRLFSARRRLSRVDKRVCRAFEELVVALGEAALERGVLRMDIVEADNFAKHFFRGNLERVAELAKRAGIVAMTEVCETLARVKRDVGDARDAEGMLAVLRKTAEVWRETSDMDDRKQRLLGAFCTVALQREMEASDEGAKADLGRLIREELLSFIDLNTVSIDMAGFVLDVIHQFHGDSANLANIRGVFEFVEGRLGHLKALVIMKELVKHRKFAMTNTQIIKSLTDIINMNRTDNLEVAEAAAGILSTAAGHGNIFLGGMASPVFRALIPALPFAWGAQCLASLLPIWPNTETPLRIEDVQIAAKALASAADWEHAIAIVQCFKFFPCSYPDAVVFIEAIKNFCRNHPNAPMNLLNFANDIIRSYA